MVTDIILQVVRQAPGVERLGLIKLDYPALYWELYRNHPQLRTALDRFLAPELGHNDRLFDFRGVKIPMHITDMPPDYVTVKENVHTYVVELLRHPVTRDEPPALELAYLVACLFRIAITCKPGSSSPRADDPEWWQGESFRLCLGCLCEDFGLPPPRRGVLWGSCLWGLKPLNKLGR